MAIEWATAGKIAYATGKLAYLNRWLIQRGYKMVQARLDRGVTDIVVMGHAGVGKTQLINHFNGSARELRYSLPAESKVVEVDALNLVPEANLCELFLDKLREGLPQKLRSLKMTKSLMG